MTENSLQQDAAEPLIWAVSTRSIGRMFDLDTSTITIAQPVSIEPTPSRVVSVTVEACAEDLYETLFPARLLTVRKGISIWRNGRERPSFRTVSKSSASTVSLIPSFFDK